MRTLMAFILLTVTLAGCSDGKGPVETDDQTFDDVQVEVDDKTGAIRGVVVNDAIIPVEGATVKVLSTELTKVTDSQGRFVFGKLAPGTYFVEVSKPFHDTTQSSVTVVAGVEEPPVLRVQLARQFDADPYFQTIPQSGFFTCTQAGGVVWGYSSSPCHSICVWTFVAGCAATHDGCTDGTVCLDQNRDFHSDVGAGWQTQIWEMQWEPSATGTSPAMGIVVSTYKPERAGAHQFAAFTGASPIYGRLDCAPDDDGQCTPGPSARTTEPTTIPAEGITDMSYFVSVRQDSAAPAFAFDQSFEIWLTQFYYGVAPEDWSFIKGSPDPF